MEGSDQAYLCLVNQEHTKDSPKEKGTSGHPASLPPWLRGKLPAQNERWYAGLQQPRLWEILQLQWEKLRPIFDSDKHPSQKECCGRWWSEVSSVTKERQEESAWHKQNYHSSKRSNDSKSQGLPRDDHVWALRKHPFILTRDLRIERERDDQIP